MESEVGDPRDYRFLVWARWTDKGFVWYGAQSPEEAIALQQHLEISVDQGPVFITSGDMLLGLAVGKDYQWIKRL